jgi:chromosome segregation ATPase
LKQIQHELQSIVLMNPDLNVPALSSTSMNSASIGSSNVTVFTPEIVQAIVDKQSQQLVLYRKQEQELQVEFQQVQTEMTRNTITLQDCQQRMTVLQRQYGEYQVKQQQKIGLIAQLNEIRQSAVLMESGFDQVSTNVTIEELLQEMKTTEDEARELMIIEKAGKVFVKRFKKLRQQQPNKCPCCGQGMTDPNVVQYYDQKIQTIFDIDGGGDSAGAKSKASVEEYKQILTRCGELSQQMQTFAMQFLPLQTSKQELDELQTKQQSIQQQTTYTLQPRVTSLENQLQNVKKQVHYHQDLSHQLKDFATRSTNSWQRIQQLQDKKQSLVSQHMMSYGSAQSLGATSQWMMKSMEEMQRQYDEHCEERQFLQGKLQKLITEEMNYTKRYTMQQQQYYEKERQVTTYEMEHQKLLESEKSIVIYQQHLQTIEQELSSFTNDLMVITNTWNLQTAQLKSIQDEVYRMERVVQEVTSQRQQELLEVNNVWNTWKDLQGKLGSKNDYNYDEINTAIDSYMKQIQEYEQEKGKIQESIRKLQQELHSQESVKSNYAMNIELRQLRQDLVQLETKAQQLQQYLPSLPPSLHQYLPASASASGGRKYAMEDMEKLSKKFLQEKQSIQSEHDMLKGRMEEMHRQGQEYEKKLNSSVYKKTQDNFRKKTIEYETTLLAVTDLDNYYTAL